MDLIAVGEGVGAHLVRRADLKVDVVLGTEGFEHGIETLPRPPKPLAQPMDGDTVVVVAEAVVGGLKLLPEGVGRDEPRTLLVVVEPGVQGLADGRVAGGWAPSGSGTPVEQAIEALEEGIGQADTDDPRSVLGFCRHRYPSFSSKHYML
jgi:hypothetical protein